MKNERVGVEIERKYIIERPSEEDMSSCEAYSKNEILQVYLKSDGKGVRRVRKSVSDGTAVYTYTKKVAIDKMSAVETEKEISESEFVELMKEADAFRRPINKIRHRFLYQGSLLEVDEFPKWKKTCLLETELADREKTANFPDFIRVVREVTGIPYYTNAMMAVIFPDEDHL